MPTFLWLFVEWYGILIVYVMAGMDTLVKAVQTMQFGEVSTYFQNGYTHWYDIIVAGILM